MKETNHTSFCKAINSLDALGSSAPRPFLPRAWPNDEEFIDSSRPVALCVNVHFLHLLLVSFLAGSLASALPAQDTAHTHTATHRQKQTPPPPQTATTSPLSSLPVPINSTITSQSTCRPETRFSWKGGGGWQERGAGGKLDQTRFGAYMKNS